MYVFHVLPQQQGIQTIRVHYLQSRHEAQVHQRHLFSLHLFQIIHSQIIQGSRKQQVFFQLREYVVKFSPHRGEVWCMPTTRPPRLCSQNSMFPVSLSQQCSALQENGKSVLLNFQVASCLSPAFIICLRHYAQGFACLAIKDNIMQRLGFMHLKLEILQVTHTGENISTQAKDFEFQNS